MRFWILWLFVGLGYQQAWAQSKPTERLVDTIIDRTAISQGRMQMHIRLAKEQNKADIIDGVYDRFIDRGGDTKQNKRLADALFYYTDRTVAYIENNIPEDVDKRRYLARLIQTLSDFNRDIDDGLINPNYYIDLVHETYGFIQSLHQNRYQAYINEHIAEPLYALRSMFEVNTPPHTALVEAMASKHPDILLNEIRTLQPASAVDRVIAGAAKTHPKRILNLATSTAIERDFVHRNTDPRVQQIRRIADSAEIPLRAIYFIEPLRNNELNMAEVDRLCRNDAVFYKQLIRLRQAQVKTPERTLFDAELNHASKQYVNTMNELHNAADAVRFQCIENFTATELYYTMVYGNDELYTSSFLGCYKRLMHRMKPLSGNAFLDSLWHDKFRTFIRLCANYNTLNDFLATMLPDAKTDLMRDFVEGLDQTPEGNLEGAVDVANSLGSISDSALLNQVIETLRQQKNRFSYQAQYKGYKIYNILYAMMVMNSDSLYQYLGIPPITNMPIRQLADSGQAIVQQIFFYGDADGKGAFNAWVGGFTAPDWKVIHKPQWVEIVSKKGHPMHMYVNRPFSEPDDEKAQHALQHYLDSMEIHPTVIIHRGHSYHLPSTLSHINPYHKVVILGACGAYQHLATVLNQSPNAHIVSSKQIGAGKVNGPIIKAFNTCLLQGKDVDWVAMWNDLGKQFSGNAAAKQLFDDYVPPYKNMGALFLRAYNE
ncbi:MAG: hypothetical protein FGM54_00215 [Chitinophagaceae bacterium]|nr:hypothetical protein [Chitinophagaceae bacterium]